MILYIIVWKKKVWWKNQFLVDFLHCLILKNVDDLACVGGTFWQARSTPVQLNLSWGTDLVFNPHILQRLPLFVCERKREAWIEPFCLFDQSLTSLHSVNGSLCRSGEDLLIKLGNCQFEFVLIFAVLGVCHGMYRTFWFANALLETQKNSTTAVTTERPIPIINTRKAPATLSTCRKIVTIYNKLYWQKQTNKSVRKKSFSGQYIIYII